MALPKVSRPAHNPPAAEDRFTHLAVTYLARRERTESQLADYLLRKGAPHSVIGRTIERFRSLGYLDDVRLARRWAEARLLKRPIGAARLREELLAKGIAERLVADTVARNVVAPAELSVGVLTSFCGAPVFVYLLRTRARRLL